LAVEIFVYLVPEAARTISAS